MSADVREAVAEAIFGQFNPPTVWRVVSEDHRQSYREAADAALRPVRALIEPQWRRIPLEGLPDSPGEAYSKGRNDLLDALRAAIGDDSSRGSLDLEAGAREARAALNGSAHRLAGRHIGAGANAEDCPACGPETPYPWICWGDNNA